MAADEIDLRDLFRRARPYLGWRWVLWSIVTVALGAVLGAGLPHRATVVGTLAPGVAPLPDIGAWFRAASATVVAADGWAVVSLSAPPATAVDAWRARELVTRRAWRADARAKAAETWRVAMATRALAVTALAEAVDVRRAAWAALPPVWQRLALQHRVEAPLVSGQLWPSDQPLPPEAAVLAYEHATAAWQTALTRQQDAQRAVDAAAVGLTVEAEPWRLVRGPDVLPWPWTRAAALGALLAGLAVGLALAGRLWCLGVFRPEPGT